MTEKLADNPIDTFLSWLDDARQSEPDVHTAMTLATADGSGRPSARMVLLKEADTRGFVFYTNAESRKGEDLAANPNASLVFHWKSLKRQVRIDGTAERVTDEEADAYFATRSRGSQIAAWASDQSRPITSRLELERRMVRYTARFGTGAVPRPPHWTGYRIVPSRIEFWQNRAFRLHERSVYTLTDGDRWQVEHLFP